MGRGLCVNLFVLCIFGMACTTPTHRADRPSPRLKTGLKEANDTLEPPHFASGAKKILENKESGCVLIGPYQGEAPAKKPSKSMSFDAAMRACSAMGRECHGVTTAFYAGAPYTLMLDPGIAEGFRPDKSAYGTTYLQTCPSP